jgi:hypothetical protein
VRSLAADWPCHARVSLRGEARRGAGSRTAAAGEATRFGGGDPHDQPPRGSTEGIMSLHGVEIAAMSYPTDLP